MSKNSGRFETTTKTKIQTPKGNILKVTHYDIDEEPYDKYKVRPKCSICGENISCLCYNDDNSDDPLQSAINTFYREWACNNIHCICEYMKTHYTRKYEELATIFGDDESAIVESLLDEMSDYDDESIFCEI